ncbi:MAG: histidine phosphatase family protein [Bacilli bacterium]|jgi:broad specificity phosphatase PhoE|nr:histidine phosphatase family protein [Bacilli bacterium]
MNLYLIRHGITDGNLKKIYNGQVDEKLNQDGIIDLTNKKHYYDHLKVDYAYCSTMQRAMQSYDILFPDKKVDEYRQDLIEMNFGDWTGTKYHDKFKELLAKGYTFNDLIDPDNGETYQALFKRTTAFLEDVLTKHIQKNNIVVVSHGLVIAAIMYQHFLKDKNMYELSPDNGLGYVIEFDNDKMISVNKIAR